MILRRSWRTLAAALLGLATIAGTAAAQDTAALRRDVERRFEVLPLQNGLALRPKAPSTGVRSVELTDGIIAIDGMPATGAELRDKLGPDAEIIIRLSYLDPDARRTLFTSGGIAEAPPGGGDTTTRQPRTRRSGDRIRFGGSVTVDADEIVAGDIVVIGGSARIDGEVTGDVVVIGGTAELGPQAVVERDLTVVGGALRRAVTARIGGEVKEIAGGPFDVRGLAGRRWSRWPWSSFLWWGPTRGSAFAFVSTIARIAVLCLLVCVVLLVGREHVERVGARAAADPFKAGVIGLLAQLLFFPLLILTIVVLVVTIVGIPLLALIPFALLALAIAFLLGFAAVAYDLGRFVNARFGWFDRNAYATAVVGIIAVLSPVMLGRIVGLVGGVLFPVAMALLAVGFLLEYAAWTVGLGAVALLRFDRKPTQDFTGSS